MVEMPPRHQIIHGTSTGSSLPVTERTRVRHHPQKRNRCERSPEQFLSCIQSQSASRKCCLAGNVGETLCTSCARYILLHQTFREGSARSGLGNVLKDPNGILAIIACPSLKTIDSVLYWYTMTDLSTANFSPLVRKMQFFWGQVLWDLARTDTSIFAGMVAFTLRKKHALTHEEPGSAGNLQYARLAELTSINIFRQRAVEQMRSGRTLVCMGGFALMALLNNDHEQALIHLRAMASTFSMLHPNELEWLVTSWVDLRVASLGLNRPLVPYYIPQYWLDQDFQEPSDLKVGFDRCATLNVRQLGTLTGLSLFSLFKTFRNLHKSTYLVETPILAETPPYAVLFDLIYEICSMDSSSTDTGPRVHRGLILVALKLMAWRNAARYVTQGGEIQAALLNRADSVISQTNGLVAAWKHEADIKSLLWTLTVTFAESVFFNPDKLPDWTHFLREVCLNMKITTVRGLQRALKDFPCLNWWFDIVLTRHWTEICPPKAASRWQSLGPLSEPNQRSLPRLRSFPTVFPFQAFN
ncbi:hypothetical protein COCC4DRAFT_49217 [Bipolaris maydis ATCC 48331]|uniref:Transcription factor domain-containing protein n=2 Tax=Cochliobolus heterostrophus TaxID=5016 RepID=M2UH40_COCH5|nr:uncharacterized protein COCC4DRAFT_49217 [Bipolaris maydis ATCC 48331]EMD87293.1 hypothetical protein COCHEDRAFT_1227579 [Bipolaris maydis C5]KAJ5023406.1 hypothetical protein J3E73DRAFT_426365 [Bipolaris maydis]ENI06492.1 hypothetical protein COCC4DRAFT_49217 [Bipolaris maydis ATCC 48331]KAJ6212300.1 hypothetical protein PSV09DRAFT_1227579 [Bipolaris maydis]KAJ6265119.1 hypothetical protein PSV08DRAFT_366985 [Bipolaris maydis]